MCKIHVETMDDCGHTGCREHTVVYLTDTDTGLPVMRWQTSYDFDKSVARAERLAACWNAMEDVADPEAFVEAVKGLVRFSVAMARDNTDLFFQDAGHLSGHVDAVLACLNTGG